MAALVDTSVWIEVFRDEAGLKGRQLKELLAGGEVFLSRFTQLELLQGCRDEEEWTLLSSYLETQTYPAWTDDAWERAARIYFDLRRQGNTVRSPVDCCIAQLALDHDLDLIHRDRDFEVIATVRELRQIYLA